MGLCPHIFLIDLQDPFTLLNVKKLAAQSGFHGVYIQ